MKLHLTVSKLQNEQNMSLSYIMKKLLNKILVLFLLSILLYIWGPSFQHLCCTTLPLLSYTGLCFSTETAQSWNLLYHLGGNGPWIQKRVGTVKTETPLPDGCKVDQVHIISRHAERYPTKAAGARHLQLLESLRAIPSIRGSLSFIYEWDYFTDPANPDFENLTTTGPYAGTRQAFNSGEKLRQRYDHLVDTTKPTNFWSCSSPRDVETAREFANGFFGFSWSTDGTARLHVIPESLERGGDTLTPGTTCLNYRDDQVAGHDLGYLKIGEWQKTFCKPIIERLKPDLAGFELSPTDVYSMMEMCGFEILVRGASPWCNIFTQDEWLDFEYARDLLHFYRAGPGNRYAGALGLLWLKATLELIHNASATGVYLSFVHDGDIVPLMATLELFDEYLAEGTLGGDSLDQQQNLPTDRVKVERNWKTSDIVPMGGRAAIERISCQQAPFTTAQNQTFVRLIINDGHISLKDHVLGDTLEHDMRLQRFEDSVDAKERKFGDIRTICGFDDTAPSRITFLHQ